MLKKNPKNPIQTKPNKKTNQTSKNTTEKHDQQGWYFCLQKQNKTVQNQPNFQLYRHVEICRALSWQKVHLELLQDSGKSFTYLVEIEEHFSGHLNAMKIFWNLRIPHDPFDLVFLYLEILNTGQRCYCTWFGDSIMIQVRKNNEIMLVWYNITWELTDKQLHHPGKVSEYKLSLAQLWCFLAITATSETKLQTHKLGNRNPCQQPKSWLIGAVPIPGSSVHTSLDHVYAVH